MICDYCNNAMIDDEDGEEVVTGCRVCDNCG